MTAVATRRCFGREARCQCGRDGKPDRREPAAPTHAEGRQKDAEDNGAVDHDTGEPAGSPWAGGPVELDKIVPALLSSVNGPPLRRWSSQFCNRIV